MLLGFSGLGFRGVISRTHKAHKHKHFIRISLPSWASLYGEFIWDIPILNFAYVLLWGRTGVEGLRCEDKGSLKVWA